jgi:aminoglycoside phosphotransferase family enzyme/predicted kinase
VYKVKKDVDLGYLDYTTLESRRLFCQREVELNRRLSPDVYLGVVPITPGDGRLVVEGEGEAVEYAVKMLRLPQERMMDVLLEENRVSEEMVAAVARRLVEFHQSAETGPHIEEFGSIDVISRNAVENFEQTAKYIGVTISREKYAGIKGYTEGFIQLNESLFRRRVEHGRIRDCHGDLHAEHICFCDGIQIYDCIEFNERFRYSDVAAEIAFLAMDMDRYGHAELSRAFVRAYVDGSGDGELLQLLNFYKCYRACVRGKVDSFALDDPDIAGEQKRRVRNRAISYFDLAHAYTRARPVLLITTGLVGTGKTTLARALARRSGLAMLSSDVIRKRLAGVPDTEHRYEGFGSGIYSAEFSRRTYDAMFAEARRILEGGDSVILDASFIRRDERLEARRLAEETGAHFLIVECRLDAEQVRDRLERRARGEAVSDGHWGIYEPQRRYFEVVDGEAEASHVVCDASLPVEVIAGQVLDELLRYGL